MASILINNVHLIPERTVIFFIKKQNNKKLYVFQRCHISMYIQSRWCIKSFSTCSLLWCSTKNWSWQISKDKNVSFLSHYQVWHIYFQLCLTKISLHSNRFQIGFNWLSSWTDCFLWLIEVHTQSVWITPLCHWEYSWFNEWHI